MLVNEGYIDSSIVENNFFFNNMITKRNVQEKFEETRKKIFERYGEEKDYNDIHKKLIEEGNITSSISQVIRNDDITQFQEISSQSNFNFNQILGEKFYEICSLLKRNSVSLICYAAFCGSVKIFKYLLLNNVNLNDIGKYAVAGGNLEIFRLCVQNGVSFNITPSFNSLIFAIRYHNNDIFYYLYENIMNENIDISKLVNECIESKNYEILKFLLEKNINIVDDNINYAAIIGNLYLVKYFLQNCDVPFDILLYAAQSNNLELFNFLIKENGVDVNAKDFCFECKLFL